MSVVQIGWRYDDTSPTGDQAMSASIAVAIAINSIRIELTIAQAMATALSVAMSAPLPPLQPLECVFYITNTRYISWDCNLYDIIGNQKTFILSLDYKSNQLKNYLLCFTNSCHRNIFKKCWLHSSDTKFGWDRLLYVLCVALKCS